MKHISKMTKKADVFADIEEFFQDILDQIETFFKDLFEGDD